MTIRESSAYKTISQFYGTRRATRSQVLLMDHIDQGIEILIAIGSSKEAMRAFCLHPLFQGDADLNSVGRKVADEIQDTYAVMLAMEYRHTANAYLSHHDLPSDGVKLSCLWEVNDMLIADKVQNRKDFELYHKATHPRSTRLQEYFQDWLTALNITENEYQELVGLIS